MVYAYATTMRRAQGSTLDLLGLFFDRKRADRGYAYVGVSRAKVKNDVYLLGSVRRTDWLPVGGDPRGNEQSSPGPMSWSDSQDSDGSCPSRTQMPARNHRTRSSRTLQPGTCSAHVPGRNRAMKKSPTVQNLASSSKKMKGPRTPARAILTGQASLTERCPPKVAVEFLHRTRLWAEATALPQSCSDKYMPQHRATLQKKTLAPPCWVQSVLQV